MPTFILLGTDGKQFKMLKGANEALLKQAVSDLNKA